MSQRASWGSVALVLVACGLAIPQARADFELGNAGTFAVLYEGGGGNTLNFNNSNITGGSVGIAGTGKFNAAGGCNPSPCIISGAVDFSAANTGQFSDNNPSRNTTIRGGVSYGDTNVQADMNYLNTLSYNFGLETGSPLTIADGGSVNASSGKLDANGNYVFTATLNPFDANKTFTINGTSNQFVVINIADTGGHGFNGAIVLTGGIGYNNVLFNFTAGNYTPGNYNTTTDEFTKLGGGDTLQISTNGATTDGIFLDPNGDIQINHSTLLGHLYGGDSKNMQIVSGAEITPEPNLFFALLGSTLALGLVAARRRRKLMRSNTDDQ